MADATNQRNTVIEIVNEVERRLGYTPSASVSSTRTSQLFTDFLNDVVSFVADYGDWPQLFEEVEVSGVVSAQEYEINASAPVLRLYEAHFGDQITPLWNRTIEDIRLLQRTSATGVPRQYALVKTSGVNPIIRVYPRPGTGTSGNFSFALYTAPEVYGESDETLVPPFSSRLLVQGLEAAAILDENGGVPNPQSQAKYALFERQLREEYNRHTTNTSTDLRLIPPRRY